MSKDLSHALFQLAEQLLLQHKQVLTLHAPTEDGKVCSYCEDDYPCRTVRVAELTEIVVQPTAEILPPMPTLEEIRKGLFEVKPVEKKAEPKRIKREQKYEVPNFIKKEMERIHETRPNTSWGSPEDWYKKYPPEDPHEFNPLIT